MSYLVKGFSYMLGNKTK